MVKEEYYNDLINAASKWNRTEIEVYRRISEKIDKILKEQENFENKRTTLKALIAYFEGKSAKEYYSLIIQIAYAVLIAAISILFGSSQVNEDVKIVFGFLLLLCAVLFIIFASFGNDFEKSAVLYILKDKLRELEGNFSNVNNCENVNTNKDMDIFECEVIEKSEVEKNARKFLVKISRQKI